MWSFLIIALGLFIFQFTRNYELEDFVSIESQPMKGKNIIITGASNGLGYETALALTRLGGSVTMACRSMERCEKARQKILNSMTNESNFSSTPQEISSNLICQYLDTSNFTSIHEFVKDYQSPSPSSSPYNESSASSHNIPSKKVDLLINNAGIMAISEYNLILDQHEIQMITNHLGHFLLTNLLLPIMSNSSRIINHSSGAHIFASWNFPSDVNSLKSSYDEYNPWIVYGNTKQANLLFTNSLIRYLANDERHIEILAVHPGWTATNLFENRIPNWELANHYFGMKPPMGALSQILAAVDRNLTSTKNTILGPRYLIRGPPTITPTLPTSWSIERQDRLWELSEEAVGQKFSF